MTLFTPGPLTTSESVKAAMRCDLGSREADFIAIVREVRSKLLAIVGAAEPTFTTVLLQGAGTYAIEATIGSAISRAGKLLVYANGAYGERIAQIAKTIGIDTQIFREPETQPLDPDRLRSALTKNITHVAVVHCETSTGIINPIESLAAIVASHGARYIVDAMSSFAGIPISLRATPIDFLVSSANKCVQGVPGLAFVIVRRSALEESRGRARSVSFDLAAQVHEMDRSGQFRFTPPTHVIAAANRALDELAEEGGVPARAARYAENHRALIAGMTARNFETLLPRELQSHIITAFLCPRGFEFAHFHAALAARDLIIYPGKVTQRETFRIGAITTRDIAALLHAIAEI